jgi:gluconolactonase
MLKNVIKKILCLIVFTGSIAVAQSPVPVGAKLEKVATGIFQGEGPVWYNGPGLKNAADSSLIFSDITGNKMYQYTPATGKCVPFLNPSDSSNGMTFDHEGRLVFCQMGLRRVARMDTDGTVTPLASTFRGKLFNSPNDVVVKSDGSIFFTDPNFNIPGGTKNQQLPFCGIYRISPSGEVQLLDSTLSLPNGICFSLDESKLYVNDSHACIVYVWDVIHDSTLANKRVFATIKASGYADGMKFDSSGNLFCTGPVGVWVFNPSGACVDTILIPSPDVASNCAWGDPDRKTLYITTGKNLYRIRLATSTGVKTEGENLRSPSFELFPNFPNPFNPTTAINYQLAENSFVSLKVYDLLGREIRTLVSGMQRSGAHTIKFDGSNLASGVYLYRLSAQNGAETKEMVLLK